MYYNDKDKVKFAKCNKLISRGAVGSSSHKYMLGQILDIEKSSINCGEYNEEDIVGVSVNGNRKGRITFDSDEVYKAIDAGSTIITDNEYDRNRPFNIGERELARFLASWKYGFFDHPKGGVWKPIRN